MDKEERAKYDCVKDKENLEKSQKSGKSFLYMTQKGRKETWSLIAYVSIEVLIFALIIIGFQGSQLDKTTLDKDKLIVQVDQYIKHDFKNMRCADKILYMDKYNTDPTMYGHSEMKTWLHENFIDSCKPSNYNNP